MVLKTCHQKDHPVGAIQTGGNCEEFGGRKELKRSVVSYTVHKSGSLKVMRKT